jgi:hypothetical protein
MSAISVKLIPLRVLRNRISDLLVERHGSIATPHER